MPSLDNMTIGFVGLGLMGKPMARNLRNAGAEVVVHNRSVQAVDELAAEGFMAAESPAEVAQRCRAVICMVSDTSAVEHVLFGPSGIAGGASAGTLVIDMGTTAVARTREFADRLQVTGVEFVDAPVSGGEAGAQEATLSIMAGASDANFARAKALLETLGRQVVHVGDVGSGQIAKAANQVIVGLTIGALSEALALARGGGADLERVREALAGGFADSRILEIHGRRMIDGEFEPGGKSITQQKDLRQAIELAQSLGIDLPATKLCLERYDELIKQGRGSLDHSALFTLY